MPWLLAHVIPLWYLGLMHLAVALLKTGVYVLYGAVLKRLVNDMKSNVFVFAMSRTLLGILFGLMCLGWSWFVETKGDYWGQAPARVILWWLIVWHFCPSAASDEKVPQGRPSDPPERERAAAWQRPVAVLVGVALSYLTDIPSVGSLYVY